jgi:hypothetical protein
MEEEKGTIFGFQDFLKPLVVWRQLLSMMNLKEA